MSGGFSLKALIDYANEEGWRVHLQQQEDRSWIAFIYPFSDTDKKCSSFEFAEGATHKEALLNALEKSL